MCGINSGHLTRKRERVQERLMRSEIKIEWEKGPSMKRNCSGSVRYCTSVFVVLLSGREIQFEYILHRKLTCPRIREFWSHRGPEYRN